MMSDSGVAHIVTFYSYKGGVGRTMALANVAYLLALSGKRVLAIDFDLEAPGLDRYFRHCKSCKLLDDHDRGLFDLLRLLRDSNDLDPERVWKDYTWSVQVGSEGNELRVLPSGNTTDLLDFDWKEFYAKHDGSNIVERLRAEWRRSFDVVLIDSRTGITDSAGICTVQLPDTLVLVFTANEQSMAGAKKAALGAQTARPLLANAERAPLRVVPVPSRWAGRTEVEQGRMWMSRFAHEVGPFYRDWLPPEYDTTIALERLKIPHVGYYSFGERIASAEEKNLTDPDNLPFAYTAVAKLIGDNFEDLTGLFPPNPLSASISEQLESHFANAYADRTVEAEESSEPDPSPPGRVYFSAGTLRRVRGVVDRKILSGEFNFLKGKLFLWVHKDPTHDLYEKQIFEELGATVHFAYSTDEALAAIERQRYDAVISNMRRQDDAEAGFTLRQRLLQADIDVPFVIYTRSSMESAFRQKAAQLNIAEYTNSPIELFELMIDVLRPRAQDATVL